MSRALRTVGTRAAALVALGVAAWGVRRALTWYRALGARSTTELPGVDRATLEGVAAELALRGIDVRLEHDLDLRVEPGVEHLLLDYPRRDARRVRRHLALLLQPRGAPTGS